jgi:hypothetical protein
VPRDDAWNAGVRDEKPHQRADRNYVELLQEMRLTQTAVTILFALLLTIPFSPRFVYEDDFQRVVYVATLACSAAASVLLIAPVAYHRTLFQRGRKAQVVATAHRSIWTGLVMLAVAVVGAMLLVLDNVVARAAALGISLGIGVLIIGQWFVLPILIRRTR